MNDPFSGIPDPSTPRPTRRRFEPGLVHEALRALQETLRPVQSAALGAVRRAQRAGKETLRRAQGYGKDLWFRGKRNPRTFGLVSGAIVLTLVGAYAVNASMTARSLCPPPSDGKKAKFVVLMDSVPKVAAGSAMEIHYDVCGLASGTPYRGRVQLVQQLPAGKKKKKSAKPKPLVIRFRDQVDGVATRRQQQVSLASTKPGAYTVELVIADNNGRVRKKAQKVVVTAR
jgi:hypothetical protein